MNTNELLGLVTVLAKAADHHDPNTTTEHNIQTLAQDAAGIAPSGGLAAIFNVLLSNPAVVAALLAAIMGLLNKPAAQPAQPAPPAPPEPPAPHPPAPHPTGPTAPADPLSQVAALTVNLDLFLAEGVPCPYRVDEFPDYYQIVKTDGTDALPIHGGAYLHAGYLDAQGNPITFDPGSPLDHTAVWTATRVDGGLSVFCGPGNPAKEGGDRDVANFRLAEYERTRGMDVPIHFPPTADKTIAQVTLTVGKLVSKPIRFPRID